MPLKAIEAVKIVKSGEAVEEVKALKAKGVVKVVKVGSDYIDFLFPRLLTLFVDRFVKIKKRHTFVHPFGPIVQWIEWRFPKP